ncbi:MAG: aminotransferase class I/II-fold pyridoxal phosphate-dependent enzyme [Abditibacteriota bacterium]|nr:aminotransferase class I/II-fold pyridoxal phosphate-dependent enzyme [Abditibacteriota bacterium]
MLVDQKSPHGGDVYTHEKVLDFSSNVNPAGMPPPVRRALAAAIDRCAQYPDPYCRKLRQKAAAAAGVGEEQLLFGNGASELIYSFAYALSREKPALVVAPAFCEYAAALQAAGCDTEYYVTGPGSGFALDEGFLETDLSGCSAVFLCSPSNPAGALTDPPIVLGLLKTGARVLLDVSFLELTEQPHCYPLAEWVEAYPGLVVLRAFTKSYAMAGVRLGCAMCSDEAFLRRMSRAAQCWNVSVLAQEAGAAALDCGGWLAASAEQLHAEKRRFLQGLGRLNVTVFPSAANYILLYSPADVYEPLLKKGILVRDCSDYIGLGKGYYRIAVRTAPENDRLLAALSEILA